MKKSTMTEIETRTEQLNTSLLDDISETDHSDADIDMDVRRMSMDAMKLLDSITDEVAGLENNSYKRSRSTSPASKDGSSHTDLPHAGMHELSIDLSGSAGTKTNDRMRVTPSPEKFYTNINDIEIDDEDSDDESITKELSALGLVSEEIERELRAQDRQSMKEAMSRIQTSPDPVPRRLLGSEDKEIIQRILDEEMKKWVPKTGVERFIKRYQMEGLTSQETTIFLGSMASLVWSIVFGLVFKVMHAEI
jgi:hypothetical protein